MRFERGCTELGRRAEQKLIFTTRTKTENGEEGQGDKTRLRLKMKVGLPLVPFITRYRLCGIYHYQVPQTSLTIRLGKDTSYRDCKRSDSGKINEGNQC